MQIGVFFPPWGSNATIDHVEGFCRVVEAHGYHSLWVGDHVVFPRAVASSYHYNRAGSTPFDPDEPHLEPVTLLGHMAALTTRARLGVSVYVLPMRNPLLTAKFFANLQALSRGRVALGIGVGWMREEFEALGADFDGRGAVTDEYVAILRHLWSGSTEGFAGTHYAFDPVGLAPQPDPPIPLVVGGNSEMAMRRAVRLGDGWHPLRLSPGDARTQIQQFKALAAEADREDLTVCLRAWLLDPETSRQSPTRGPSDLASRCRDLLGGYAEAGVDEFIIEFPFPSTPPERQVEWLEWLTDHHVVDEASLTAG